MAILINAPIRPTIAESPFHISGRSVDRQCAPLVQELYYAFSAKCADLETLEPFLEWIVAQLVLPDPQPFVTVKDRNTMMAEKTNLCVHRNGCMHFEPD